MVLEEGSFGQTDILHEVQVTYQKKQSRDTLRIRDSQTASKEELFPLCFMNHSSLTKTLQVHKAPERCRPFNGSLRPDGRWKND